MTIQFIEESTLTAMADAIRTGTGKPGAMKPLAMAKEIAKIKDYSNSREGKYVWSVQSGDGTTVDANAETKYVASNDTALYPLDGWIDNNYFKLVKKPETIVNGVKIVEWADGTDTEICDMVTAADQGKINLADYWAVGDTRTVQLSAMNNELDEYYNEIYGFESHEAQSVELVLMHAGGYDLNTAVASGRTKCSFVVGMKDCLTTGGFILRQTQLSKSWGGADRRLWCNRYFKNSMPSTLLPIFKQFKTITAETRNGTTLNINTDWFALAAEKEIFGSKGAGANNVETASADIFQFDWYKTSGNRIKKYGLAGSAADWWERSPAVLGSNTNLFCIVRNNGWAMYQDQSKSYGISPFGCI